MIRMIRSIRGITFRRHYRSIDLLHLFGMTWALFAVIMAIRALPAAAPVATVSAQSSSGTNSRMFAVDTNGNWSPWAASGPVVDRPPGQGSSGGTNSRMFVINTSGAWTPWDGNINKTAILCHNASSVLSVASNIIAPTNGVHHVGAGLIKTVTVPSTCAPTCVLHLVPDAAFTYDATGNLVVPSGGGTAVVNRVMVLVWDGTKWTPSY